MDANIIGQMSANLSFCFGYIIVASLLCFLGCAAIVSIVWFGIFLWKWSITIVRHQFNEYRSVWKDEEKNKIEDKPAKKVKS